MQLHNCFRVLTLSVQSLFQDLLLERVRQAFSNIWVPIGAPIGAPFDGNGGIVVGYRFHVFSDGFREPAKSHVLVGGGQEFGFSPEIKSCARRGA